MQPASLAVPNPTYARDPADRYSLATTAEIAPQWAPHEQSWLELGGLPWFRFMPRGYYRLRWAALYPLQWRILWGRMTLGELVAGAAMIGVAAGLMIGAWSDNATTGNLASIATALTFLLASRNSIWTFLLGLPFERAISWHALMAYLSVGMGIAHGIISGLTGGEVPDATTGGGGSASGSDASGKGLSGNDGAGLGGDTARLSLSDHFFSTGVGLLAAMGLLILISALPLLRRWGFELFLRLHIILFLTTTGFAVVHGANAVLFGAGAWALDVLMRKAYVAGCRNPREAQVTALPGDVVRIAWPKGQFQYSGGQYVFLCVPAVSLFEWHPFSLSSHPQHDQVYLHARVLGNWTRALHALALSKQEPGGGSTLKVLIEGPYGAPKIDLHSDRYSQFLLISGGIGVTPMQSIFNDLLGQRSRGRAVKKLWFVWSVRDKHLISNVLQYDHKYARQSLPAQLPTSFSPDLITPHTRHAAWADEPQMESRSDELDFVNTEFYLTGMRDHTQFDSANIRPELQPCLRFGRPDLDAIMQRMRQLTFESGDVRAAVCVCGPGELVQSVKRAAAKYSGGGVQLDVHAELFDL